jgi:putative phosphoesterase
MPDPHARIRVGLISDTHGLLRPEAIQFLRGCAQIIHGGDIGDPRILTELAGLAPVTAVHGNNDRGAWAESLPEAARIALAGIVIHVLHDLARLDVEPSKADIHVVVSGHSHKPSVSERNAVLYVNPGSAGRRRFKLPISVGELWIHAGAATARTFELECR